MVAIQVHVIYSSYRMRMIFKLQRPLNVPEQEKALASTGNFKFHDT